ncbi:hypothetical protein CCHR01_05648 [Colletotrichum chrysophilum]|uniref:Uncharacterized protein n=1 Tax=Colletotrichum chrysophilum TaxID=1836956 RepID=A0AAD9EP87_9PEZI|nr:hypothetical protein CCHR01_05648 [Colletotrichum chrysophilum]
MSHRFTSRLSINSTNHCQGLPAAGRASARQVLHERPVTGACGGQPDKTPYVAVP